MIISTFLKNMQEYILFFSTSLSVALGLAVPKVKKSLSVLKSCSCILKNMSHDFSAVLGHATLNSPQFFIEYVRRCTHVFVCVCVCVCVFVSVQCFLSIRNSHVLTLAERL